MLIAVEYKLERYAVQGMRSKRSQHHILNEQTFLWSLASILVHMDGFTAKLKQNKKMKRGNQSTVVNGGGGGGFMLNHQRFINLLAVQLCL